MGSSNSKAQSRQDSFVSMPKSRSVPAIAYSKMKSMKSQKRSFSGHNDQGEDDTNEDDTNGVIYSDDTLGILSTTIKVNNDSDCCGIWSHFNMSCKESPQPRVGHFTCSNADFVYIGLGTNQAVQFEDVWQYDLRNDTWKQLKVKLEPRNGSRAVVHENFLLVFGGYCNKKYYSDVRVVNIAKSECYTVATKGERPSPRSTPIISYWNKKLIVWGGYNGKYPNDLFVLSMETLKWRMIQQKDVIGRTGAAFTAVKEKIYVYGGTNSSNEDENDVLVIDCDKEEMKTIKTTGEKPESKWMGAGMTMMDSDFILCFGGKSPKESTNVHCLSLKTNKWQVIDVMPDGATTRFSDGFVNEDDGKFLLPNFHSFSVAYDRNKRKVLAFLGQPISSMLEMNTLSMETALAGINMSEDMLLMLC